MSGRFNSPLRSGNSSRRVTKRVRTEDGRSWKTVEEGSETFAWELNIDWNEVMREMIATAADNKGGYCRRGPLEVKVSNRKVSA